MICAGRARLALVGLVAAASTPSPATAQRVVPATFSCCATDAAREAGAPQSATAAAGTPQGAPLVPPPRTVAITSEYGAGEHGALDDGRAPAGAFSGERRRVRLAPLASAVIPGAGQAMLRQQRFLPYVALEGFAWLRVLADSREGRRQRTAYRGIARTVARAPFSATTPAGDWEYYERMEHFVESGLYDVIPGGELQPEGDSATYNGAVWLLARQTYWEDPARAPDPASAAYQSALTFYRQRAATSEYRWSWRNAELEQDVFRRTIARSNDAYRRAAQDVAVVIANHVLSTVDAFVTVRLRARRSASGRAPASGSGDSYGVTVTFPLPRSGVGSR